MSKFDWAGFLIFGLVFVSGDIEVGTNVSCEESTASPRIGLNFHIVNFRLLVTIVMEFGVIPCYRQPIISKFKLM